jgi:uncharacterized protein involved in cysteine biosynthesis
MIKPISLILALAMAYLVSDAGAMILGPYNRLFAVPCC